MFYDLKFNWRWEYFLCIRKLTIPTFNPVGMRFSGQSRSRNTAVKPSDDTDDKDKVDEKRN